MSATHVHYSPPGAVEVPDPNAPKITVERDVVEWDCGPIGGAR